MKKLLSPLGMIVMGFSLALSVAANTTVDLVQMQSLNEQALQLHAQGDYEKAASLYKQVLPQVEQHFGVASREAANVIASLADAHQAQRQYSEAEQRYQQALFILESSDDAIALAQVLNGLASSFYMRRQYGKAEPLYQRALALLEQSPSANKETLLLVLDNLSALYQTIRRNAQAEVFRQRAEQIRAGG